jgi:hypothetical protein
MKFVIQTQMCVIGNGERPAPHAETLWPKKPQVSIATPLAI